jgi:hypothetical protein
MPNVEVVRRTFQPAAVGSAETTARYAVAKGQRVLAASVKGITAAASSTTSTIQVGDGDDPDGFVTTSDYDLENAAATIRAGTGAYVDSTATGRLYTAADTVDVTYTPGTPGATNPKIAVSLLVVRDWPAG